MDFSAAVVTVSDAVAAGTRQDSSGPRAGGLLKEAGFDVVSEIVVPDEADEISSAISGLCERVDLVLTTGGTGFAERDVTPEATRRVLEKEAPGLGELMRAAGLRHTPMAALSRAIAGSRGRALILNLPGSPKGVEESLSAVIELLPHALRLLRGDTAHHPENDPKK
jgi:molybdenum cofactor synthesis domain-containing protein